MSGWERSLTVGALLLALVACGEDGAKKPAAEPQSVDDAFAKTLGELAPKDSVALVRVESRRAQDELIDAAAKRFDYPADVDIGRFLGSAFGADLTTMETGKPFGVALVAVQGKAPVPTLVAPFANAEEIAATYGGSALVSDGYVALTQSPEPGERGTDLAAGMRAGTISLRLDVAAMRKAFAPQIQSAYTIMEAAFDQPGQPNAEAGKAMLNVVRKRLDSTTSLDLTCARRDGAFELDAWLHRDGASAKASDGLDLRPLLARIPRAMAINAVMDVDWTESARWFELQMSAVPIPEGNRPAFEKYQARLRDSYGLLARGAAFALGIGENGLESVMVMRAKDADAYVDLYADLMKDPVLKELGFMATDAGERKSGDHRVRRVKMRFDLDRMLTMFGPADELGWDEDDGARFKAAVQSMLGTDGLFIELASVDDDVVLALARDGTLMDQALSSTNVQAGLEPLLSRVSGPLWFAMDMDFAPLFEAVRKAMSAATGSDGPSARTRPPRVCVAIASGPGLDRVGVTVR